MSIQLAAVFRLQEQAGGKEINRLHRAKRSPLYLGGEEINADFRKILGHSIKYGGLGIPDPRL